MAGEVKDLAQQIARATEQITARVQTTQADIADAHAAIEQISEVTGRMDALQVRVASAVEEQSATTAEMVRSVTEVSKSPRDITADIAGAAAAAWTATKRVGDDHDGGRAFHHGTGAARRRRFVQPL